MNAQCGVVTIVMVFALVFKLTDISEEPIMLEDIWFVKSLGY